MTDVIVVGGGPAGLAAALYTAKNGLETVVYDADDTWMHKAHLFNYLAIESLDGTEFIERSREQVDGFGADLREAEVTSLAETEDGFEVETDSGTEQADFVVLATGTDRDLAKDVGCAFTDRAVVDVGLTMETSVDGVYATGAMVRVEEWQAQIAAGDGAAAALNILSTVNGEKFHDFDTPKDA
ncbi:MAG: FAD-dependent oxidoreductase [Halodesulfurarchaeum sp.]